MKLTNKIIERYGADKVLHFCVCGWIVSICCVFNMTGMWVGIFAAIALSVLKELLDDEADWHDLLAGILGAVTVVLLFFATILLL